MKLNEALMQLVMYCEAPIEVQIIRRDENGCGTGVKRVPICRIKPDFDGRGIAIQIENNDVQSIPWTSREALEGKP
jgi:hypothetical protein